MTEILFDDGMNAGKARFKWNYSSLWHLVTGGVRRVLIAPQIIIPRTVLLLDVSKWQGDIDFVKMKAGGVHGVIIKCGQGTAKDPFFDTNMSKAVWAGIPRGTYWYYDSRIPPKQQAGLWWEWIKVNKGELMHFADYEENYGGTWKGWQNFKVFLEEFQRISGFPDDKIGIYTGYYYWIGNSPTTAAEIAYFARFALWEAWYTSNSANVIVPRPWTNATLILWQYGTPANGGEYGAQSIEIDENNFNGEENQYKARFNLGVKPPPPNEGDMYIEVRSNKSFETRLIRNGHGIKFSKVADLPVNGFAKSHGDATDIYTYASDVPDTAIPGGYSARLGDQWIRIYDVNGVLLPTTRENWLAVKHLGVIYTTLTTINAPPPPSEEYVLHVKDGVTRKFIPERN